MSKGIHGGGVTKMTREYVALSYDEEWTILYYWKGSRLYYNIFNDSFNPSGNKCDTNNLNRELSQDREQSDMKTIEDGKEIARYLMVRELQR